LACCGAGEFQALTEHAKGEGVVAFMLGTDCYTQAVLKLEKECRKLDDAERARLVSGWTSTDLRTDDAHVQWAAIQLQPLDRHVSCQGMARATS
jgi:hypothetical protein